MRGLKSLEYEWLSYLERKANGGAVEVWEGQRYAATTEPRALGFYSETHWDFTTDSMSCTITPTGLRALRVHRLVQTLTGAP